MNVIAEREEEYEKVHKLLDMVLAVAGFLDTIRDYKDWNT